MTEPSPEGPARAFGPALLYTAVGATALVAIDWMLLLVRLPIAGSDARGMLSYLLSALSLHILFLCVPVWVLVRFGDRARLRVCAAPVGALLAWPLTVALLVAAHAFIGRALPAGQHVQFRAHLDGLRGTLGLLASLVVVAVGRGLLEPLATRIGNTSPRLGADRVLALVAGLTGLTCSLTVALAMAPVHLDRLTPPFVLAAGLSFAAAAWLLVPPRQVPHVRPLAVALGAVLALTLVLFSRDAHGRFLLFAHASLSAPYARLARDLSDFDGDGTGMALLGGTDCAPFDGRRGPAQREVAGDGIDQDCSGADAPKQEPREPASGLVTDCKLEQPVQAVVLVTIDAWRADTLGSKATPALTQFAQQTVFFAHAYAPATFTFKSFASLFSMGTLSDISGANPLTADRGVLDASFVARLKAAGLRTGLVNYIDLEPALRTGFDEQNVEVTDSYASSSLEELSSAKTTNGGLAFVDRHLRDRFFLWLHYADAHAPYRDPKFDDPNVNALGPYERAVAYVDLHVGRLLAGLAERGIAGSTAVFITADHGEDLGKHGGHVGHGPDVYESTVHVPLLAWVPGCTAARVNVPRSTVDIGPTIGALTGVPMAGQSLLARRGSGALPVVSEALYDEGRFPPRTFLRAVVVGAKKLIVDVRNGGRVLFDLANDPEESFDVYREDEASARSLEAAYQAWLDRDGSQSRAAR
jgi:arylsulfatase A-like enzyme